MIVSTTESIAGYEVYQVLGITRGNVIRAKHVGNDIVAGLRQLVGGELSEYTKLMSEAREQAYDRVITHAQSLGADAIIGMRYTTSTVMAGSAEILAFGTAVKLKRPSPDT